MRPGETWLTISVPWAPDSVRNSAVTASSVVTARRSPFADPVAANACACACDGALREDGRGLGAERGDPVAGDELDEVAPVRADVGEGARRAAEVGVDPPVVVVGRGEPVLQVAAVDQADRAERAGADAGARLADDRVEAVDERDGRDPVGGARGLDQLGGLRAC